MAIKLSGMISGMDTDAMIDELVKAYSTRKDSYVKEQKALEYKQDAWKDMNTKIYSFFSGKLSSFRFSSNYSLKSTKTSNDSKVTVTGSSNAVNGTQELKITSLAKSGYLTGGVVKAADGKNLTGSSKVSELKEFTAGSITLKANGKETTIDVTDDMTISQFVAQMKDAGVNASFDETNQRFFVSAKNSGADNDFSLTGDDANGTALLKSLGLYSVSTADISAYQELINNAGADGANSTYIANLAKNEYLNSLVNEHVKSLEDQKKPLTEQLDAENKKIAEAKEYISFAAMTDEEQKAKIDELTAQKENATLTEDDKKAIQDKIDTYNNVKAGTAGYTVADYEKVIDDSEAKIKGGTLSDGTVIAEEDSLNKQIAALDEKIADAKTYTSKSVGEKETFLGIDVNNAYALTDTDGNDTAYGKVLKDKQNELAYAKDMVDSYNDYQTLAAKENKTADELATMQALETKLGMTQSEDGAVRITGTDAEIYLNGARFESNTNVFQINGLTITANGLTDEDEIISVTTSTDVDGIYNKVKDFFKEYNELMKSMETAYNAASAGDYEPLTDEEMEAMTDKQIEKWETKVKDAVLRRDTTLSGIVSLFKMNMSKSFEVDGERMSLSSFGIKTMGYFGAEANERGLYHIDGDADDSLVSGNADKLKKAIAEDPDKFIKFFSQLTDNVYTELNKKMSSSSVSSAYKVYNDKYMDKQKDRIEDKISDWEDKVDAMREKYEKQFAAMETALSKLQSQSSYFSSMLGY